MGRRRRHDPIDPSSIRIAIVGAGLCGLATAVALEQVLGDDASITIYERDSSLESRREGYGLTLSYRPNGTLDKLGILDELSDLDCPSRSHYILRGDGRLIGYFGNAISGNGYGQRGNLRVPRQRVRHLLRSKLKRTMIRWNHRLTGIEQINNEDNEESASFMRLSFDNGITDTADLVIAADGIRSEVVQQWWPHVPPPRPLGVRLILGLTRHAIPTSTLLQEQGFYTLEHECRLFVMPFQGSALGRSFDPDEPVRHMWQLSFRSDSSTSTNSEQSLLEEARSHMKGWHDPVSWLLEHTEDIWGTDLQDRDPSFATAQTHVIAAGDALHAMSPFKGQGANQALQDALTIAKWIGNGRSRGAVACCQRELVQRTAPIVKASREAADFWHSSAAIGTSHPWAGIVDASLLVSALAQRNINANTTQQIDQAVCALVKELNIEVSQETKQRPPPKHDEAIAACRTGCLSTLRRLSWENQESVRSDECFQIAAQERHLKVVHWLINDGGCEIQPQRLTDQRDEIRLLIARICA